ncbi:hypothetical protein NYY89_20275, partial [Acinetobacter baumannii]|nr:hypothetical protein [Acinetobacter baumannii]
TRWMEMVSFSAMGVGLFNATKEDEHHKGGCDSPPPFSRSSAKVNIHCLVMSIIMLQISIFNSLDTVPNARSLFNHAARRY